jgi:hypothetical protein
MRVDKPFHDKNHRPIACDYCVGPFKTMLQAYMSDETLERLGKRSIQTVMNSDVRGEAGSPECFIKGFCWKCNGPDDGSARIGE